MKQTTTTVNILGMPYDVIIGMTEEEDPGLENRMGYCIPVRQRIVVADLDAIDGWKDENEDAKRRCLAVTLRHEVLHAFLSESGLWSNSGDSQAWAMNEEMIDWIAMQWYKIQRVLEVLSCGGREYTGQLT